MNSKPECVRQTPRFHHSVWSTTRSHRQLVKAVKIWKTAFVCSSNVTPGALKPRSFKERLMCVEMQRKSSEVSTAPKSIACSIRDLQLCSSDSSPSPFKGPLESQHTRRRRPVHRRHYRKHLEWFHTLSRNKRPPRLNPEVCDVFISVCRTYTSVSLDHPQCTSVFTGSKVTDSCQDDGKRRQRSSPSAQSPPEFQTPARKTSRRLWRRQLDTSSSDSSRSTKTTPADVKKTRRQKQNNTNLRKTSWTEFNFLDIHSDLITDASPAHKTQKSFGAMSKKDKRKDLPAALPSVQTSDVTDEKTQQKVHKTKTRHLRHGESEKQVYFMTPSSKTKDVSKPRVTAASPDTQSEASSAHKHT
ncbi:hypothetical protein E1301_Tti023070 [Triplophysa tibetana]|uniref:Uncharacterized protein n=1 Tax=Triplophysa tibetana TaxID=1572043 RepID=A0A5A9N410_9TELE|nr:hypothetical protein E1301_Tti023070 [Triplophysa tibetana]